MKQSHKNAVMVVGAEGKAIEGQYISKSEFLAASAVSLSLFAGSLFAAVPTDVTTAITTAATDVATVGAAVVVVMVGIKVFKWLIRAL